MIEKSSFLEEHPFGGLLVVSIFLAPALAGAIAAWMIPRDFSRVAIWVSGIFLLFWTLLWILSGIAFLYLPSALLLVLAAAFATPSRRPVGSMDPAING